MGGDADYFGPTCESLGIGFDEVYVDGFASYLEEEVLGKARIESYTSILDEPCSMVSDAVSNDSGCSSAPGQ